VDTSKAQTDSLTARFVRGALPSIAHGWMGPVTKLGDIFIVFS